MTLHAVSTSTRPEATPSGTHRALSADRAGQGVRLGIEGVGRQFGDTTVLDSIDLDVAPGQFVAVVGRSGCGKSTLLRLIAGLDRPNRGRIQADGRPLADARSDTRLMFQNARLLPWKRVIDNVGIGLSGRWRSRAHDALAEVGLADKAKAWPAQLSGGQQQRVALARALIHEPQLLLLDEPLGALDALTRLEMQALIERLWQQHGFTVLLVTHDVPEAVQLADRVIVLEQGGIGLDVTIDVDRPRTRKSAEIAAIEGRVLGHVLGQGKNDGAGPRDDDRTGGSTHGRNDTRNRMHDRRGPYPAQEADAERDRPNGGSTDTPVVRLPRSVGRWPASLEGEPGPRISNLFRARALRTQGTPIY